MVVVLIIAILIAIAIPTFLGSKSRAQDKAAQSSLRNAATDAKGIYTDSDSYVNVTVSTMAASEPSLTFVAAGTASAGAKSVSVNAVSPGAGGTAIIMTALSTTGSCYVIGDWSLGGTFYARLASGLTCSATQATTTLPNVIPSPSSTSNASTTTNAWVTTW